MIEKIILDYLNDNAEFPACMEVPKGGGTPPFVVIQKTGGGDIEGCVDTATLAIQSYGATLWQAAETNETVKALMRDAAALPEIARVRLNSDYNFTDTAKKLYRYQAVFDIIHYREA